MSDYRPVTKAELRAIAEKEGVRIAKKLLKEMVSAKPYYGDTVNFNYKCAYTFEPSKKESK